MANCNRQQLNITCGTDVVLHDRLIFDGETFDPNLSVGIAANLVSSLGKRTALDVQVVDDELLISVPWIEGTLPGCYGLEVTGSCNSKKWATYADSLIKYTTATRVGVSEVTVGSDSYDITQDVAYCYSNSPVRFAEVTVDDGYGTPSVDVEYEQRVLSMDFHNLKGNGITDIDVDEQVGDEAVNTVTIKTDADQEGTEFKVRNGSRGNGIASSSEQLSDQDGGINTFTITDDDGTVHEFHSKNGTKGGQGDSAVYDPSSPDAPDFVMANTTGQSTTKAMTQKAVTDEIQALRQETTVWDYEAIRMANYEVITHYINSSDVWAAQSYSTVKNQSMLIPINGGETFRIEHTSGNSGHNIEFLVNGFTQDGDMPVFATGERHGFSVEDEILTAPITARYMYVRVYNTNNLVTPNISYQTASRTKEEEVFAEFENERLVEIDPKIYPILSCAITGVTHANTAEGVWTSATVGAGNECVLIPVRTGQRFLAKSTNIPNGSIHIELLTSNAHANNTAPSYYGGVNTGWFYSKVITIPDGVKYMYVRIKIGANYLTNIYLAEIVKAKDVAMQEELFLARQTKKTDSPTSLGVLHYSDIHGDTFASKEALKRIEAYDSLIDAVVCSGDVVTQCADGGVFDGANYPYGINWWKGCGLPEKSLFVLGNHDAATTSESTYDAKEGSFAWNGKGKEWSFDNYFSDYIEGLGVTMPTGYNDSSSPYYKACYWHKDFTAQKIRLIGLDCVNRFDGILDPETGNYISGGVKHLTTEQEQWLVARLNETLDGSGDISEGYSVVFINHYPLDDFDDRNGNNIEWDDTTHRWVCNQGSNGGRVCNWKTGDIAKFHNQSYTYMNAEVRFNNRNRVPSSASYGYSKGEFNPFGEIIKYWMSQGGKYVAWICGHTHSNLLYYPKNYPECLVVCISQAGWIRPSSLEDRSFVGQGRYVLNFYGIDTNKGLLKLMRIGAKTNMNLNIDNALCYDYINKKVINEW